MKRIVRYAVALVSAGILTLSAQPAHAGWYDGDISNWLPAYYTVKIAAFSQGSDWCAVPVGYEPGTYQCKHWWLPAGKADDQINGTNFDTDAFMVENSSFLVIRKRAGRVPEARWWAPAGQWTKFPNMNNVSCDVINGTPTCSYAP